MPEATTSKRVVIGTDDSVTVRLRNVRLSFPALFKPRAFEEGNEPSYQATFLMALKGDKEGNAEFLKQGIAHVIKTGLKGKHPGAEKICLRSGKEKGERGIDGYDENMVFCSSNSRKKVPVVDRDLTPLTEEDGKPYAGCYVNATVRLWAQDNKFGKRVNAQLRAIQFFADGEPFGESAVDPESEFANEAGDSDTSGIL